jgi:hypothetical protein
MPGTGNIFLNDARFVAAWRALRSQLQSCLDAALSSGDSRSQDGQNESTGWGSSLGFFSLLSLPSLAGIGASAATSKFRLAAILGLIAAIPLAFGAGMLYEAHHNSAVAIKTILDHTEVQKQKALKDLTEAVAKLRAAAVIDAGKREEREAADAARIAELEGDLKNADSKNVAITKQLTRYLNAAGGLRGDDGANAKHKTPLPPSR